MIYKAVCYFDLPKVLDTAVTPLPAVSSLPLQVIANCGPACDGIKFDDNTGAFIGVYIGLSGAERLIGTIGNGKSDVATMPIPSGSRVSLGSLTSSDISAGTLVGYLINRNFNQGVQ